VLKSFRGSGTCSTQQWHFDRPPVVPLLRRRVLMVAIWGDMLFCTTLFLAGIVYQNRKNRGKQAGM
jgi:hypothetical protein